MWDVSDKSWSTIFQEITKVQMKRHQTTSDLNDFLHGIYEE